MRMEADRMRNLKLTEDDWQTEREVVIEERNQRTDSDPRRDLCRTAPRGTISQPSLRHADHRLAP